MFEHQKEKIGYLIRFYRQKGKNTLQDFISYKSDAVLPLCETCDKQCRDKDSICSHKTLERVERGQPAKAECYYVDFTAKLGYDYEITHSIIRRMETLSNELEKIMKTRNKHDFQSFQMKANNFYNNMEGIFYFEDIARLYCAIANLEINEEFEEEDFISLITYMYPYEDRFLKKMMLYYICRYYMRFFNKDRMVHFLKEANDGYPNDLHFKLLLDSALLLPVERLRWMLNKDPNKLCGYEKYIYYLFLGMIYMNLEDKREALKSIDCCIEVSTNEEMLDRCLYGSYMRKGTILFYSGQYNEAIDNLVKVYYYNPNMLLMNVVSMIVSYEKAGRQSEIAALLTNTQLKKIYSEKTRVFFKYYQMKYSGSFSYDELIDYIIDDLRPYLDDKIYKDIITEDLEFYVEETKHYKRLQDYKKKLKRKRKD